MGDLSHTLHVLALALAAAGLVTTLLGAAVGRAASGRSLRPLTRGVRGRRWPSPGASSTPGCPTPARTPTWPA